MQCMGKGDARTRRSESVTVSAEEWGNKLHFRWYHVDSEQRPRGSHQQTGLRAE